MKKFLVELEDVSDDAKFFFTNYCKRIENKLPINKGDKVYICFMYNFCSLKVVKTSGQDSSMTIAKNLTFESEILDLQKIVFSSVKYKKLDSSEKEKIEVIFKELLN